MKEQINPKHARIKNRSFKAQKYRDDLAKELKSLRTEGKDDSAYNLLNERYKSSDYVVAKYGYTKEAILKLIEVGNGKFVISNLDKFEGWIDKELFIKLLEEESGYWRDERSFDDDHGCYLQNKVASRASFQGMDKEVAQKLIEKGLTASVISNFKKFQGLDKEIADILITYSEGYSRKGAQCVIDNLNNFHGLNHKEVAQKLIKIGLGEMLADNLEKFQGLDHKAIAFQLIEDTEHYYYEKYLGRMTRKSNFSDRGLINNFGKFQGLDREEINKKLRKNGSKYTG